MKKKIINKLTGCILGETIERNKFHNFKLMSIILALFQWKLINQSINKQNAHQY